MDATSRNICATCATPRCPPWPAGWRVLTSMHFPQHDTLVPEFDRVSQDDHDDAEGILGRQVASRRPRAVRRCRKEYVDVTNVLLDTLDKLSGVLAADVNHQDATIDQLLSIKQTAWLLRNTAGEASLIVSTGLAAGKVTPEVSPELHQVPRRHRRCLERAATGHLRHAIAAGAVGRDGREQDRLFRAAISAAARTPADRAHRTASKPELTANQWSPITVGRLSTAVGVAEAALDAAKERAVDLHASALRSLIVQLLLLTAAVALAAGALIAVTRRVIGPLHRMRDAMLKVAAGDLSVDTGYVARQDEIGALATALETFKQQAEDKLKIEAQERERNAGAAARQRAVDAYVAEFEGTVRQTLQQLGEASGEMRKTSTGLSTVSRQTNSRVEVAQKASGEASMSVESVASAAEELSASINDISQQAAHAAGHRQPRRRPGARDRRHRAGSRQIGGPDRRSGRPDQHHCRADQPARAERHHRGRTRRRSGPRLCRRRLRSQIAGEPDREGDRRDLRADRRHPEGRGRSHRRHQGHRLDHRRGQRGRDRDRRRRPGTGRRDAGDHALDAISPPRAPRTSRRTSPASKPTPMQRPPPPRTSRAPPRRWRPRARISAIRSRISSARSAQRKLAQLQTTKAAGIDRRPFCLRRRRWVIPSRRSARVGSASASTPVPA